MDYDLIDDQKGRSLVKTLTITFHASNNHGSFLQAYALQRVLTQQLQAENQIIDYRGQELIDNYRLLRPLTSGRALFKNIYSLLHLRNLRSREQRFESARQEFLQLTPARLSSPEDLSSLREDGVVYIAGSDQVWNCQAPDYTPAFLLPGLSPKFGYGISFGSTMPAISKDMKAQICEFKGLSFREHYGAKVVSDFYPGEVKSVLDPTLLLSFKDYREIQSSGGSDDYLPKQPYIFYYSMKYNKSGLRIARQLARDKHMPVLTVYTNYHSVLCGPYGISLRYDAGPAEFLTMLGHASLVVTDSYHGCLFSILAHKDFIYSYDEQHPDLRIDSILKELGIWEYTTDPQKPGHIPWDEAEAKLSSLRQESMTFLSYILHG